jgi:hypothetical protein
MIAEAIEKVGPDGVLSIDSSSSFETRVEVEEGMEVLILRIAFLLISFFVLILTAPILDFAHICRSTEDTSPLSLSQILRSQLWSLKMLEFSSLIRRYHQ